MTLLKFRRDPAPLPSADVTAFLRGASIEVTPKTAAKIADFGALLPRGTCVAIAHIGDAPIDDMVATAARLRRDGMEPVPHLPARAIRDRATLTDWLARYRGEAGVACALLLAGAAARPSGDFASSMDLLDTGLFGDFRHIFVAGHPEGNRDIDPDGGEAAVMSALHWKADFAARSDAAMAILTQFVFDAAPVIAWARRLEAEGVGLPVHVGIAGPAKLQTLIRYAIACGVGPSLQVLQKRAQDVTKLLLPFAPDAVVADLARHKAARPDSLIAGAHMFPLGGITATAGWLEARRAPD